MKSFILSFCSFSRFKKVVVSYMRTYVHKGLVNRLVQLAKENVWLDELTISHDHSCWLRHKESKQTKYNFSHGNGGSAAAQNT